jgi:hypothetical protein
MEATPSTGMRGPQAGDLAADGAAIEHHLVRCAEDVLGADRTAVLADRLTTLAGHLALISAACREPLFGRATAPPEPVDG